MKKKILGVMLAICMLAGFVPMASYATESRINVKNTGTTENPEVTANEFQLSELISDTTTDDTWAWGSGQELPIGSVITNDTSVDLEIIYVTESISTLPTGVSPEVIAPGAKKTLTATEGVVTTAGQWKICGNRKGGSLGENVGSVKFAMVVYPVTVTRYKVTFDNNGYGTAPTALTEIACGSKIKEVAALTAQGYVFGGWYKEATGINAWNFAKDTITSDTVLYAKWTKETGTTPTITSVTPKDAVYGYGDGEAYVSATVSNVTGYTYTYQWYSSAIKANNGGTAISGATSAIYNLPTGKNAGEYYYYCVATANGNGQTVTLTSEAVAVTIKKAEMEVKAQDVSYKHDGTNSYGITVAVTKPASGYTIKYGEAEGDYILTTNPLYKEIGSKKVYFQIVDSNNNYETYTGSATVSIVDGTAPTGNITVDGKSYSSFVSSISFGTPIAAPQKVTITSADSGSGVGTIYYYITQSALSATQVQDSNLSWKTYTSAFYLEDDKKYIVYAKLTDKAGNIRYISTGGMVLDGTEPKISGISDGGEYCQSVNVTVTDTNLSKVMLDSTSKTVSSGKSTFTVTGDGKEHTITAIDTAGNETEYTFTLYAGHSFGEFEQTESDGVKSTEVSSCEHDCGKTYRRVRTNAEIREEYDPSGGSIIAKINVASGAPATSVTGLDTTLAKSLIGSDAATQAAKGVTVMMYLDVTRPSSVASADKTSTENAVKQYVVQNLKEGMYLDLSLYTKKGSTTATKITKSGLGKTLKISLTLPESLKAPAGTTRTYYVVRVHGGTATVLNTTLADGKITFDTDRFSTYSIWYTESGASISSNSTGTVAGATTTTATTPSQTDGTTVATGNSSAKDGVPKTGDEDMSFWYGMLCLIGAVGTIYFGRKKFLK